MRFSHETVDGIGKVLLHADDGSVVTECLMTQFEPLVYDTACDFLPDGAVAAEIGSFKGGSACILGAGMARRSKRLTLHAHDLFEPFDLGRGPEDIESAFDAAVRFWNVPVVKVRGDSKRTHAVHADGSLDYVFVDGDHGYEGALADIRNFAPKVKPDGWLLVQDTVGDVERAVRDGLPREFHHELVVPPYGHYVTVCHRDEGALRAYLASLNDRMQEAVRQNL